MTQTTHFSLGKFNCFVINDGNSTYSTAEFLFSNAVHYMWNSDWEMGLKFEDELTPARLVSTRDQVELLEQEKEIFPGINLLHAPGQTQGHTIVSVYSENEVMLCISDLVAHPIHIECTDWNMSHEYDSNQAAAVRIRVLKKALTEKLLVYAFHLEFPGLGYVIEGESNWK